MGDLGLKAPDLDRMLADKEKRLLKLEAKLMQQEVELRKAELKVVSPAIASTGIQVSDRIRGPPPLRRSTHDHDAMKLRVYVEIHVNRKRWGGTINWPEPESVRLFGGVP